MPSFFASLLGSTARKPDSDVQTPPASDAEKPTERTLNPDAFSADAVASAAEDEATQATSVPSSQEAVVSADLPEDLPVDSSSGKALIEVAREQNANAVAQKLFGNPTASDWKLAVVKATHEMAALRPAQRQSKHQSRPRPLQDDAFQRTLKMTGMASKDLCLRCKLPGCAGVKSCVFQSNVFVAKRATKCSYCNVYMKPRDTARWLTGDQIIGLVSAHNPDGANSSPAWLSGPGPINYWHIHFARTLAESAEKGVVHIMVVNTDAAYSMQSAIMGGSHWFVVAWLVENDDK